MCKLTFVLSCVWLFAAPWTVACQTPLSIGLSRQELSGLLFTSPGDLSNPGIEPRSFALVGRFFFFNTELSRKPSLIIKMLYCSGTFVTIEHLYPHIIMTQRLTLGIVHSVGLDECVITCIHHYNMMQNIFTALKILCALPIYPYPLSLVTNVLFIVSVVLLYPECHGWNHTVCNLSRLVSFT